MHLVKKGPQTAVDLPAALVVERDRKFDHYLASLGDLTRTFRDPTLRQVEASLAHRLHAALVEHVHQFDGVRTQNSAFQIRVVPVIPHDVHPKKLIGCGGSFFNTSRLRLRPRRSGISRASSDLPPGGARTPPAPARRLPWSCGSPRGRRIDWSPDPF